MRNSLKENPEDAQEGDETQDGPKDQQPNGHQHDMEQNGHQHDMEHPGRSNDAFDEDTSDNDQNKISPKYHRRASSEKRDSSEQRVRSEQHTTSEQLASSEQRASFEQRQSADKTQSIRRLSLGSASGRIHDKYDVNGPRLKNYGQRQDEIHSIRRLSLGVVASGSISDTNDKNGPSPNHNRQGPIEDEKQSSKLESEIEESSRRIDDIFDNHAKPSLKCHGHRQIEEEKKQNRQQTLREQASGCNYDNSDQKGFNKVFFEQRKIVDEKRQNKRQLLRERACGRILETNYQNGLSPEYYGQQQTMDGTQWIEQQSLRERARWRPTCEQPIDENGCNEQLVEEREVKFFFTQARIPSTNNLQTKSKESFGSQAMIPIAESEDIVEGGHGDGEDEVPVEMVRQLDVAVLQIEGHQTDRKTLDRLWEAKSESNRDRASEQHGAANISKGLSFSRMSKQAYGTCDGADLGY